MYRLFFFTSRRRHTRCLSDWSSDVCSSDLKHPRKNPPSCPWYRQNGPKTERILEDHIPKLRQRRAQVDRQPTEMAPHVWRYWRTGPVSASSNLEAGYTSRKCRAGRKQNSRPVTFESVRSYRLQIDGQPYGLTRGQGVPQVHPQCARNRRAYG